MDFYKFPEINANTSEYFFNMKYVINLFFKALKISVSNKDYLT